MNENVQIADNFIVNANSFNTNFGKFRWLFTRLCSVLIDVVIFNLMATLKKNVT